MQIYAARTPSPCPTCLPPFPTARTHVRRRPSKIGPAGRHLPAAHCKLQLNVRRSSRQTTSAHGAFRPRSMSVFGRLSNRPFGVKHFQAIHRRMSLAGSCFSSESAARPFHHGVRGQGGTICRAALSSDKRRIQATGELTSSIVPRGPIIPSIGGKAGQNRRSWTHERRWPAPRPSV